MRLVAAYSIETDGNQNIALLNQESRKLHSTDLSSIEITQTKFAMFVTFRGSDGHIIIQNRVPKDNPV